jgi:DNA-binding NarL/FixJ family response regulator
MISEVGLRAALGGRAEKQASVLACLLANPSARVAEIARKLDMNPGTIRGHVNTICHRLGITGTNRRVILPEAVHKLILQNYQDVCVAEGWTE